MTKDTQESLLAELAPEYADKELLPKESQTPFTKTFGSMRMFMDMDVNALKASMFDELVKTIEDMAECTYSLSPYFPVSSKAAEQFALINKTSNELARPVVEKAQRIKEVCDE